MELIPSVPGLGINNVFDISENKGYPDVYYKFHPKTICPESLNKAVADLQL